MSTVTGQEHWTTKKTADGDVKLFLWEKYVGSPDGKPAVLFVHGSSMASQPTFDLKVPGRPHSSAMDYFIEQGYDCWCMDMEGYGRSTKDRGTEAFIWEGADDLSAGSEYIMKLRNSGPFMVYGISSGALRAAAFAQSSTNNFLTATLHHSHCPTLSGLWLRRQVHARGLLPRHMTRRSLRQHFSSGADGEAPRRSTHSGYQSLH